MQCKQNEHQCEHLCPDEALETALAWKKPVLNVEERPLEEREGQSKRELPVFLLEDQIGRCFDFLDYSLSLSHVQENF